MKKRILSLLISIATILGLFTPFGSVRADGNLIELEINANELLDDVDKLDSNYFIIKKDRKYGMSDEFGNIVLPIEYDDIEADDSGNMILEKGNNYGLASNNGKVILECEYEHLNICENYCIAATSYYNNNYRNCRLYDIATGKRLNDETYDFLYPIYNDQKIQFFFVDYKYDDGLICGIIDNIGNIKSKMSLYDSSVTQSKYDDIDDVAVIGNRIFLQNEYYDENEHQMIDLTVLDLDLNINAQFTNEYKIIDRYNGMYGYNGDIYPVYKTSKKLEYIEYWSDFDEIVFLNNEGKIVYSYEDDGCNIDYYENLNMWLISIRDGKDLLLYNDGCKLKETDEIEYNEEYFSFAEDQKTKYYLWDSRNQNFVETFYTNTIYTFPIRPKACYGTAYDRNGKGLVAIKQNSDVRYVYIVEKGCIISDKIAETNSTIWLYQEWDDKDNYIEYFKVVNLDYSWSIYDKDFNILFTVPSDICGIMDYHNSHDPFDGKTFIADHTNYGYNTTSDYYSVDLKGNTNYIITSRPEWEVTYSAVLLDPQYTNDNSLFQIYDSSDKKYKIFDKFGNTLINLDDYGLNHYGSYSAITNIDGKNILCKTAETNQWGVINIQEKTVIPFEYDYLYIFDNINGTLYAVAQKDGKYGIIDSHGNIILPFTEYDIWPSDYYHGLSATYIGISYNDKTYYLKNPLHENYQQIIEQEEQQFPIKFTPTDPDSDSIHSTVLDGGTVYRYYYVTNEYDEPYENKTIYYSFGNSDIYSSKTDENGMFTLKIPNVYAPYGMQSYTQWFQTKIVTSSGEARENVTNAPSVMVDILPRGYTQSIECSSEIGVVAKDKTKITSSEVGAKANTKLSIDYEHHGGTDDQIDLTLKGVRKTTASAKTGIGLFANLWGNKDLPSLNLTGASVGASGSIGNGGSMVLKDYYNENDPQHKEKARLAAYYTLGTLYTNITASPIAEKVLDILYNKLSDAPATSRETETSVSLSAGSSAGVGINNVIDNNISASATVFSSNNETSWSYKTSVPYAVSKEKPLTETSTLTAKTAKDYFKIGITNKFESDDKKAVSKDILKAHSASTQTSQSITASKDENGEVTKLSLKTQWPTTNYQDFTLGFDEYTNTDSFSVSVENEAAQEALAYSPQMQKFVDRTEVMPSVENFAEYFDAFSRVQNEGTWKITGEEAKVFNQPIAFPITETISIGAAVGGKEATTYTKKNGTYNKNSFTITDEYDGNYYTNKKDKFDYLNVAGEVIADDLKGLVDTAVSAGAGVVEKGKAAVKDIAKSINISITRLKSNDVSLQMFSLSDNSGNLDTAYSIGDVYIVNAVDENENVVEDFAAENMELSLSYEGYNCDNVDELDIYLWDDEQQIYQKCNAVLNEDTKTLTMPFTENGQYILGVDTSKPVIENLRYSIVEGTPCITANISDDFSEIDTNTVELAVDSVVVIDSSNIDEYYNKNTGELIYPLNDEWEGNHSATALAGDMAGNISDAAQISFTYYANNIEISHTPIKTADKNSNINISAEVTNASKCYLSYKKIETDAEYTVVEMSKTDSTYSTQIPNTSTSGDVEYYITATDDYGNVQTSDTYDIWIDSNMPIFINSSTSYIDNDNVIVSASLIKTNENAKGTIIAAAYGKGDALLSIEQKPLTEVQEEVSFSFENNDIQAVQIFIWDSVNGMTPLAKSKIQYIK